MARTVTLATVENYNGRRYSNPWACEVIDGQNVFLNRVFDGTCSRGGEIKITDPVVGRVYGCGQRDNRGRHTTTFYMVWTGTEFIPCDRKGNVYDEDSTEYEDAFCGNGTVCAYLERQTEAA